MTNYTYSRTFALVPSGTSTKLAQSATGKIYDINDTARNTPLNLTLVVGGAAATQISTDSNGQLPDFYTATRTSVVWKDNATGLETVLTTTDPVPGAPGKDGKDGNQGVQGPPGDVSLWAPGTWYPLNKPVVTPSGDLVYVTTAHTSAGSYDPTMFANSPAVAGKASIATIQAASDPLAYLDNVAILCQFPVRENGETLWPQGISINQADNEIYVSNSDGPATILRIDVRDLTTGVRKSSKSIAGLPAGSWSQALPWFKDGSGNLCFVIRDTAGAATNPSTYAVYNYTTGTLGSSVSINGSTNADVCGNFFITSDAWVTNATRFYLYDWASIQAGTPNLLATVPIENPGATIGKVQGIAIVGSYLYLLQGEQNVNPAISVYDFNGRLVANRNYTKTDFQAAVNLLKPGYLTNNSYIYECEGGTNLGGKLVTCQIVNNNPAVTADGIVLIMQHNRIDGAAIHSTPATTYVYDTGWQTVTMGSGWTASANVPLAVRRIGNQVRIRGQVINSDSSIANTYALVGTLPTGFRPPLNSLYFAVSANTTTTMSCRIDPGGGVNLWASAATGAVRPLNGITYLLD